MPFVKGQSGNPSGRPKLTQDGKSIAELARAHTDAALDTLVEIMTEDDQPAAARVSAAGHILDRGWGKPSQMIEAGEGLIDLAAELTMAKARLAGLRD